MSSAYTAPLFVRRWQQLGLIAGVVFLMILAAGAFLDRPQFFRSYLYGFTFWVGISVGSLALLMLQHLTGGGWGLVIRRVLEAATRTLPLMLLLFVPVAIGLKHIYAWTDPAVMGATPALQKKAASFLHPSFFIVRSLVYFAIC